jgi:prolyl 4-hydroxylase
MKKLHRNPYTVDGFKKIKMPKSLYKKLLIWYLQNEKNAKIEINYDNILGTIRNVNKSIPQTQIIHLQENMKLYNEFNEVMLREVTEWSGVDNLEHTSTYGIRMYERGDVLISHTDRPETHILSAICSIYQEDMDEPWALEIKDPQGWWHEVYFEPGDMVFYESDILEHGRMRPLKGHKYANMYVHFKPADYNCGCGGNTTKQVPQINPQAFVGFHNAENYRILSEKNDPNSLKRFEKVLTKTECKNLIKEYSNFVQARTHSGNVEYDKEIRKAENAVYEEETPLLQKVREIIAEKTNTHISQQEYPISIIKYEKGGEYKPHHDHWAHQQNNSHIHPQMGNRWKTAILYLNDDYKGGETHFPNWNVKVKGKPGELVTWDNLNKNGSPNMDTLHAGLPVEEGTKYIVVSWIRQFPYTPQTIKI